jgi:ectoine hydroxylase-related dioxygenase (phytanoyl-CoA dioxygenase family)
MDLKRQFERDGFVILPAFYSSDLMDRVTETIAKRKIARPLSVVVDLLDTNERTSLGLLPTEDIKSRRMKINDLYLDMPDLRSIALSDRLSPILRNLLGHAPTLCNSLYFEKGSAQPPHVDSIYMTPKTPGHLIATWVALEDTDESAGPLEYFPGSHRIERFLFDGKSRRHYKPSLMGEWHNYMDSEVERLGLKKQTFSAKKGDVFVWHSDLLHGGAAIKDDSLTRRSLVFHYFSRSDSKKTARKLRPLSDGYWMDRPPQAIPLEAAQRVRFERNYRIRYPDVDAAITSGQFHSARQHYELYGREEGRSAD